MVDLPISRLAPYFANPFDQPSTDDFFSVRFSHDGEVDTDDNASPIYDFTEDATLLRARGRLTVGSSETTVVNILKNGSVIGFLSWGSGDTLATGDYDVDFVTDSDTLQVQCIVAGEGAVGISIRFDFIRNDDV